MFRRVSGVGSRVRLAPLYALAAFGLVVAVSASAPAVAATPGTPGTLTIRLGGSAAIGTSDLPNYSTVVLGMNEYSYIAGIKSKSPSTRVLGYKSGTELDDACGTYTDTCDTGITYQQAVAHDASSPNDPWVLRNSSGNSIVAPAYPNLHLANVASASYQRQWLSNVVTAEKKYGYDGVFLDSVLGAITGWSGGVVPTLYPSDSAWESAMKSFVAANGPALKAQGFYVLANAHKAGANDCSVECAWWQALAPYVNGLVAQTWEQSPVGDRPLYDTNPCCWTGHWLSWLNLVDAAQSAGADFFGGMSGTASDTVKSQYGRASFLLAWNGKGGGFLWWPNDGSYTWNGAATVYVGTPTNSRYQVGVGWRRDYTGGTVLVNPHYSTAQTFNLGGSYVTPSGSTVSSVTLQPTTAMVLKNATSTVSAPANTSPPAISGSAQQGQTLTASQGSWSGSPTSYAYQWSRCDSSGGACANISGATGTSYLLGSGDLGFTIRVLVTARNSAGSAAVSSAATAVVTVAPAPAPASSTTTYHQFVGKTSGKCVDDPNASTANGTLIQQWGCWSGSNQQWKLVAMSGGYYEIVNRASGKCLDVQGQSLANGALVQQWGCWGGANQLWKLVSVETGYYQIVNKNSGKCLDVKGQSLANGAQLQQWACWSGGNQRFRMTDIV